MIRPITVICWILALGAGLYLYRAKHEVALMDKHIDQIAKQTSDLRAESRRLLDDWIRLGEPEQLHKYSDEYLGLKTIAPTQFTRLGDLPARLPEPRADPADEQPDVVAQSPDGPSSGVPSSDIPSSGVLAVGVQSPFTQPAGADSDMTETDDEALPVPPIPPAAVVTAVSAPAVISPPLQARPVTPRPAAGQPEPEASRPRPGNPARVADEPNTAATRRTPAPLAESNSGAPDQGNGPVPGQAAWQARGLPPLQAQGPKNVQGMPPVQAQGSVQAQGPAQSSGQAAGRGPAQGPAFGLPPGQPTTRPAEPRSVDTHANEAQREVRSTQLPPLQAQSMAVRPTDTRDPGIQIARQGPSRIPATAPAPGGSLLGMPRGPVPLPLPAPTPVSTTWPGNAGTGPAGYGR
jgi:hypothetical protein